MITIVGNLKGGAGKSTVAFNLAIWLQSQQKKVLCYDFDPQLTLSDVAGVREEEGFLPPLTVSSRYQKDKVAQYDEILIDVGTANMTAMKRAIAMADRILIPVAPSQADVWSTQRFLYLISSAIRNEKPPQISVFINRADTHKGIRETAETEEALRTLPGIQILKQRLCQRTAYRRSFSEGLAVFELNPRSKAAEELMQLAYTFYYGESQT